MNHPPPSCPLFHTRSDRQQADLPRLLASTQGYSRLLLFVSAPPISKKGRRSIGRRFPRGGRQRLMHAVLTKLIYSFVRLLALSTLSAGKLIQRDPSKPKGPSKK